jgi:hypothetical protein
VRSEKWLVIHYRPTKFTSHFSPKKFPEPNTAPGTVINKESNGNAYFLGSHLSQFFAYSSTLSLVTGISSPLTKLEGGFL